MSDGTPGLLVIAGEASGDHMAAAVLGAIGDDFHAWAVGGEGAADDGLERIHETRSVAAMGILDVARRTAALATAAAAVVARARRDPPRGALLVKFTEANPRLGRWLRGRGVRVVWCGAPGVGLAAWRARRLASAADAMAVLLPFEQELCERTVWTRASSATRRRRQRRARAAGRDDGVQRGPQRAGRSPDEGAQHGPERAAGAAMARSAAAARAGRSPRRGCRRARRGGPRSTSPRRLRRWPSCPAAAGRGGAPGGTAVRGRCAPLPRWQRRHGAPAARARALRRRARADRRGGGALRHPGRGHRRAPRRCFLLPGFEVALCASGTATLEAALAGAAPVVAYRLDALAWQIARRLVTTPHVALPNVVLGRRAFPELLQDEVTAERVAASARQLLVTVVAGGEARAIAMTLQRRLVAPDGARFGDQVAALIRGGSCASPRCRPQ
ncbi:MAG: hypothetical protein WKG00_21440 [Polyangiaceae bacterium]